MKLLFVALTFLIASPCDAISNRVIGDLETLREIGFDIKHVQQRKKGVMSFSFVAPAKYTFESGDTEFTKPFSRVSYMRTMNAVAEGPGLLGAPASSFHLASRVREDHRHECGITLLTADTSNCFLAVSFREPGGGTWSMVIHIPVTKLLEQIKAEQDDARQPANGLDSSSKD